LVLLVRNFANIGDCRGPPDTLYILAVWTVDWEPPFSRAYPQPRVRWYCEVWRTPRSRSHPFRGVEASL